MGVITSYECDQCAIHVDAAKAVGGTWFTVRRMSYTEVSVNSGVLTTPSDHPTYMACSDSCLHRLLSRVIRAMRLRPHADTPSEPPHAPNQDPNQEGA